MGKMKIIYLILICGLLLCSNAFAEQTKKDISKADYIDGIYIPRNLEETWVALEKDLVADDRKKIRSISEDEFVGKDFFGSMGLRNDWGLWRGSRLAKYFNGLGIYHPDDMSLLIRQTFWCHINNKPMRLDERIAYFKEFWIRRTDPVRDTFPEKNLEEIGAQDFPTPQGKYVGYIRVYKDDRTGNAWLYEYNKGWKRLDNDFLNKYPHWKETLKKKIP
jgi:hypothetical protein